MGFVKTKRKGFLSMKIAIVTGASSGIGKAAATRLSKAGWKVGALARRKEKLEELEKEDANIMAIACDVTQAEQVETAVKAALNKWPEGAIELFVANAGIMKLSHLDQLRVSEWKEMVDININGVLMYAVEAPPNV